MKKTTWVVALMALGLGLSGCGDSPERAATIGESSAASSSAAATPEPPKAKGAGDQLTAAQAKAALLTAADLPTGWSVAENEPEDDSDDKVEPASCEALFNSLDGAGDKQEAAAEATGTYTEGGMLGAQLEMTVSSYKDDGVDKNIQEITDALTTCAKITTTDEDGVTADITMSPLSFPNLGDQTLAIRMTVASDGLEAVADAVLVAVGHNVVSYVAVGFQPMPGAELEKVARSGMERVSQAAKS